MNTCEYCDLRLCNIQGLRRHLAVCKSRDLAITKEKYALHIEDLKRKYERQLEDQKACHRVQLQFLADQYELQLQSQQERIERLENQIFEIAKQPTTNVTSMSSTSQRIINIVNQLGAYEFIESEIEQILEENFTPDVFLGGPDKIAELTARHLLTDPITDKPRVVCTDVARRIFRYVDPVTRELLTDVGFQRTHQLLRRPLGQANLRVFSDKYLHNDPDDIHRDQWKKNDDFIEDPNKFPSKLQPFLKK